MWVILTLDTFQVAFYLLQTYSAQTYSAQISIDLNLWSCHNHSLQ